tara:strand:- start:39954 stop:40124 length:171 start_codon:yes stop_codon:yes gene_type:complete
MVVTSAQYVTDNLGNKTCIKSTIDNVECEVPMDTDNRHYQAIQEWVKAGNTIEEAD